MRKKVSKSKSKKEDKETKRELVEMINSRDVMVSISTRKNIKFVDVPWTFIVLIFTTTCAHPASLFTAARSRDCDFTCSTRISVTNPAFLFLQVFHPPNGAEQKNHAVQASALLRENSGITRGAGMHHSDHLRSTHQARKAKRPSHDRVDLQERGSDTSFTNKVPGKRHPRFHATGVQDLHGIQPEFSQRGKRRKHP